MRFGVWGSGFRVQGLAFTILQSLYQGFGVFRLSFKARVGLGDVVSGSVPWAKVLAGFRGRMASSSYEHHRKKSTAIAMHGNSTRSSNTCTIVSHVKIEVKTPNPKP